MTYLQQLATEFSGLRYSKEYDDALFTLTIDWSKGNTHFLYPDAHASSGYQLVFLNPQSGGRYILFLGMVAYNSYPIFPANVRWSGDVVPSWNGQYGWLDMIKLIYCGKESLYNAVKGDSYKAY